MKRTFLMILLVNSVLLFTASSQVQARTEIQNILTKGSKWTLNVDGEVGTLELLGGRGSRTSDGGWKMTMDIEWQGNRGTLKAWADGENREQHVILEVQKKNGIRVTCEGYIAQYTERFMAGISKYRALPQDIRGAWFATRSKG